MSKTFEKLAKLLSASNEQLFDRYVNFTLHRAKPIAGLVNLGDFSIKTPATGLKPSITVAGELRLDSVVTNITLTVINMSENIDTMAYNYASIEVGYLNSGIHTKFTGRITNCYMAKPNPNGELVVSVVNANVVDLYAQGAFSVTFSADTLGTLDLVKECVQAIRNQYPRLSTDIDDSTLEESLPVTSLWRTQSFGVGKATRQFRSPLGCITWLNSVFASFVYNTGFVGKLSSSAGVYAIVSAEAKNKLPPIKLGFDNVGKLRFIGDASAITAGTVKALHSIGSALLTSPNSATVTAPFNPDILPGEVVFIDTKYFKTRVNIQETRASYSSMGNLWYILSMQFTFSTQTTNTMTLMLNNIQNVITAKDG